MKEYFSQDRLRPLGVTLLTQIAEDNHKNPLEYFREIGLFGKEEGFENFSETYIPLKFNKFKIKDLDAIAEYIR